MAEQQRTAHASTQTFGLALIATVFLAAVILALIVFGGEEVTMFAILTAIVGGAAFVTWRFDTQWARALGLVGTVLALGGFFLGFGIFQVFSPIEFVLGLAYVTGWVLSLVGGIRAILASRKDRTGPSLRESRTPVVVLGVIGVAAVVSVAGFLVTRQTVSAEEAAGATEIDMTNFEFEPGTSSLAAGATILVKNSDPFAHDFTLDEFDISERLGPGSEVLIDLAGVTPGTYTYFCSLHSDGGEGMIGTIVIDG
jgi:plastocyanin